MRPPEPPEENPRRQHPLRAIGTVNGDGTGNGKSFMSQAETRIDVVVFTFEALSPSRHMTNLRLMQPWGSVVNPKGEAGNKQSTLLLPLCEAASSRQ